MAMERLTRLVYTVHWITALGAKLTILWKCCLAIAWAWQPTQRVVVKWFWIALVLLLLLSGVSVHVTEHGSSSQRWAHWSVEDKVHSPARVNWADSCCRDKDIQMIRWGHLRWNPCLSLALLLLSVTVVPLFLSHLSWPLSLALQCTFPHVILPHWNHVETHLKEIRIPLLHERAMALRHLFPLREAFHAHDYWDAESSYHNYWLDSKWFVCSLNHVKFLNKHICFPDKPPWLT